MSNQHTTFRVFSQAIEIKSTHSKLVDVVACGRDYRTALKDGARQLTREIDNEKKRHCVTLDSLEHALADIKALQSEKGSYYDYLARSAEKLRSQETEMQP